MAHKNKKKPPTLTEMAFQALKEAVAEALAEHKRRGLPVAIWQNGKVEHIPPNRITVPEIDLPYGSSGKGNRGISE